MVDFPMYHYRGSFTFIKMCCSMTILINQLWHTCIQSLSRIRYNSVQSSQKRVSSVNLLKKNKRSERTSEKITMSFKSKLNLFFFPSCSNSTQFNVQINFLSKTPFESVAFMECIQDSWIENLS